MLLSPSRGAIKAHPIIGIICPNQEQESFIKDLIIGKPRNGHNEDLIDKARSAMTVGESTISIAETSNSITLVFVNPKSTWSSLIEQVDGVIAVLDGDLGLDPMLAQLWAAASDQDVPRIVVAPNTFRTRADFDEIVAIVQRVLEPDVLVRYLPIDDDLNAEQDTDYVGLFDLLSNDIRVYFENHATINLPDHEHFELTNDQREDLIEELVHTVLDDDALNNYSNGLPLNFSKLRELWNNDEVVSVLPVTNNVGADLLVEWIESREQRHEPIIHVDDHMFSDDDVYGADALSAETTYGIAIAPHVIKLWGAPLRERYLSEVKSKRRVNVQVVDAGLVLTQDEVVSGESFVNQDLLALNSYLPYFVLPELSEN